MRSFKILLSNLTNKGGVAKANGSIANKSIIQEKCLHPKNEYCVIAKGKRDMI